MATHDLGHTPRQNSRVGDWLHCLAPFLLSAYPLSIIVVANEDVLPMRGFVVLRLLSIGFVVTALLLLSLRPVVRSLSARAMWLSVFYLAVSPYGFVVDTLRSFGVAADRGGPGTAALYTLASLAIASAVVRPWRIRARDPLVMLIVAVVLISPNAFSAMSGAVTTKRAVWRDRADALIASTSPAPRQNSGRVARDIYYIVLDGFGREDTLRHLYNLDLSRLVSILRSKGFYVADGAQSNYAQTFLSLASTLNLEYVDDIAAMMGPGGQDLAPLDYLIQHNALMRLAKQAGYDVIGIGSNYRATDRLDGADVCICTQFGLDEFEQAMVAATPVAGLPLQRWTYGAHRRKIHETFAAVESAGSTGKPTFVFAHVVAPHPPFVFWSDGSPRQDHRLLTFADGDRFPGSRADYVAGYSEQARFLAQRVVVLVEHLLNRAGPPPVVVVQGDHGPGSMLTSEDPRESDARERMPILAAYFFPAADSILYPTITPVNGARALARQYLGVDLPFLPDRSALSTADRPYDLLPVPPVVR